MSSSGRSAGGSGAGKPPSGQRLGGGTGSSRSPSLRGTGDTYDGYYNSLNDPYYTTLAPAPAPKAPVALKMEDVQKVCDFTGAKWELACYSLQLNEGRVEQAVESIMDKLIKTEHIPPAYRPNLVVPVASTAVTFYQPPVVDLTTGKSAPYGSVDRTVSIDLEQEETQRAIANSLAETNAQASKKTVPSDEPENPFSRTREATRPAGLKNVGNTCYVNSLLQSYYALPPFRAAVATARLRDVTLEGTGGESANDMQQRLNSLNFLRELQRLIAMMMRSERKYLDPSAVLAALRDHKGQPVAIGGQQDVGEFNHMLLGNLENALKLLGPPPPPSLLQQATTYVGSMLGVGGDRPPSAADTLQRLFYGKSTAVYAARELDNTPFETLHDELFMELIVEVEGMGTLLRALEAYTGPAPVEDLRTPRNHRATGTKEVWLTDLPDVLTFQLQRVRYSQTTGQGEKIHDRFTFPQQLLMDRYLYANREQTRQLRSKEQSLQTTIANLRAAFEQYTRFNNGTMPLDAMLEGTAAFLSHSSEALPMPVFDPAMPADTLQAAVYMLRLNLDHVRRQMQAIQADLAKHEHMLASAVAEAGLSTRAYRLHAVMVHSGEAGSGHYWVYVHDRPADKWYKFNDVTVTQASLAEVEESSYGGDGVRSAYCVVYVSESAPGLRDSGPGAGFGSVNVEWGTVDADARQLVQEDNSALYNEHQAWNQRQAQIHATTIPTPAPAPLAAPTNTPPQVGPTLPPRPIKPTHDAQQSLPTVTVQDAVVPTSSSTSTNVDGQAAQLTVLGPALTTAAVSTEANLYLDMRLLSVDQLVAHASQTAPTERMTFSVAQWQEQFTLLSYFASYVADGFEVMLQNDVVGLRRALDLFAAASSFTTRMCVAAQPQANLMTLLRHAIVLCIQSLNTTAAAKAFDTNDYGWGIATGSQLVQQSLYLAHVGLLEPKVGNDLREQWHNLVSQAFSERNHGMGNSAYSMWVDLNAMLFNCNVHLENPPAPTLVTLTTPTPPATQLAYRLMQAAMGVHAIIYRTETRAPEPLPTQAMDVVSDVAVPPPNGPSDQNHTAAGTTQATEAHSDQAEAMASTQTAPEPAQTTVAEQSAAPTMGDDAAPSTGPAPVHANTGPQQAQEPDPAMAMSQTTAPDPTDDKDKEYEMVSSGQPTTVAPEDGPSGASSEAGFVVVEIPKEMETNRPSAAPPVTSVRAELGTTAAYEVIPGVGAPPGDGGGGGAGSGPFL